MKVELGSLGRCGCRRGALQYVLMEVSHVVLGEAVPHEGEVRNHARPDLQHALEAAACVELAFEQEMPAPQEEAGE